MNILIFETNLNGHRLEYIHHLYMLSLSMPNDNFYFILSERFQAVESMFEWPNSPNVTIELIAAKDEQPADRPSLSNLFKVQRQQASILNYYVEKYRIDKIFAIVLLNYFPFMPLFLNNGIRIDGIQYSLFPWANKGFFLRKADYLKYMFYKVFTVFDNVYTLNDHNSANRLNKILLTNKFVYIPDPFVPIPKKDIFDFRKKYKIRQDQVVFAHFGGLQSRKGTLLILESIKLLSSEEKDKYVFVFAGRVYDGIKNRFYSLLEELKGTTTIIVKDDFCSYDYLAALCEGCNAILMPYYQTTQSSGLLGYASQFMKPVIAPSQNLIGNLVEKFNLGYRLPVLNSEALVKAYNAIKENSIKSPTSEYCSVNCVTNFQNVIKNGFSNKR